MKTRKEVWEDIQDLFNERLFNDELPGLCCTIKLATGEYSFEDQLSYKNELIKECKKVYPDIEIIPGDYWWGRTNYRARRLLLKKIIENYERS